LAAIRQRLSLQFLEEGRNLRAAVESTVKSIRKPLSEGKLGVRNFFLLTCMLIDSAVMTILRRIQRYLEDQESKKGTDKKEKACQDKPFLSFFLIGIIKNMFSWLSINLNYCFVNC